MESASNKKPLPLRHFFRINTRVYAGVWFDSSKCASTIYISGIDYTSDTEVQEVVEETACQDEKPKY